MKRTFLLLISLVLWVYSAVSWGQGQAALLDRIKFTAVELLIYTDQLQRFELTACRTTIVSSYQLEQAKQEVLLQLKPEHRPEFGALFGSEQVARLLQENKAGVEALLGPQKLLRGAGGLDQEQLAACREMGELFQDNYLQTRLDLQQLFEDYRR